MADLKVLIIGAGPTGMTAAIELTRMGVPVRLIEHAAKPSTTSRALAVQARVLELFAQRGMVQPMLDKGNPASKVTVFGDGKQLFQMDFTHNGTDFPYMLMIPQSDTEQILRDELAKLGVSIEREVEHIALAVSDHDGPVTATLRHKDAGVEEVRCQYLIDCEGAHSITRATLGLEFQGKTRTETYVLGDIYIDGGPSEHELTIFSSERGFLGMFPMQGGRFRLIASHPLSESQPGAEPALDEIQTIYNQRSHIPGRFHDMVWSSYFHINSRMINQLHKGRVFLAGDSAHIHSPAGGQGMNTGIQDAINLGWKLAMVIHGKASTKLLDTYTDDRVPVIRGVLEGTEGLTDVIGAQNFAGRFAIEHFAPWLAGTELVQTNATRRMSQVLFDYRKSPLSKTVHASGSLHAGDRIPNLLVAQTRGESQTQPAGEPKKLQALLSPDDFTLLLVNLENSGALHIELQNKLAPWKDLIYSAHLSPQQSHAKGFNEIFGEKSSIVLVRPDGYAAFVGTQTSLSELADYLLTWFPGAKM
jgi:2-polyprenyl-6-methoxyphenol hydroxylase-like FAD-dependent oxidoreductase